MRIKLLLLLLLLLIAGALAGPVMNIAAAQDCRDAAGAPIRCPPTDEPEDRRTEGDRDGDGTIDALDACPDVGGPNNNQGCPEGVIPDTPESQPPQATEEPLQPAPGALPPLPTLPQDGRCVVAPDGRFNVNVREQPSLSAQILKVLTPQDVAPVAYSLLNAEGLWYKLLNMPGYVSADVVRLGGDCDLLPRFDMTSAPGHVLQMEILSEDPSLIRVAIQIWDAMPGDQTSIRLLPAPGDDGAAAPDSFFDIFVDISPVADPMPPPEEEGGMMLSPWVLVGFNPQPEPPGEPVPFMLMQALQPENDLMIGLLPGVPQGLIPGAEPLEPGVEPDCLAIVLLPARPEDEIMVLLMPSPGAMPMGAARSMDGTKVVAIAAILQPMMDMDENDMMPLSFSFGNFMTEIHGYESAMMMGS